MVSAFLDYPKIRKGLQSCDTCIIRLELFSSGRMTDFNKYAQHVWPVCLHVSHIGDVAAIGARNKGLL